MCLVIRAKIRGPEQSLMFSFAKSNSRPSHISRDAYPSFERHSQDILTSSKTAEINRPGPRTIPETRVPAAGTSVSRIWVFQAHREQTHFR
jgi:hypothetical protein